MQPEPVSEYVLLIIIITITGRLQRDIVRAHKICKHSYLLTLDTDLVITVCRLLRLMSSLQNKA